MDDRPLPVRAVVDGHPFHGAYDDLVRQVEAYAASLAYLNGTAAFSNVSFDGLFTASPMTLGGPMLFKRLQVYNHALTATQLLAASA